MAPAAAPRSAAAEAIAGLRELIGVLWRSRLLIAAITFATLLLGLAALLTIPSQYSATAQLLLDPRPRNVVDGPVMPSGLGSSAVGADTILVDSQLEVIQSNAILKRVATKEKFATDKEWLRPAGGGLRIAMRNAVGALFPGFEPETKPTADPLADAIQRFREKNLSVNRLGNTYVINVDVMSRSPQKAAKLANAIAETYVSDQLSADNTAIRGAADALERRTGELRDRVRIAEQAVEKFRTEKGLLGVPGLLFNEQQLQSQNDKLATARAEKALAKARYDQLRGETVTSLLVGATPAALNYTVIVNLRAQLGAIERRMAGLQRTLGRSHPDLIRIKAERQGIVEVVESELARVRASAKNEYELAAANEKSVAGSISKSEKEMTANNESLVKLRELQREADAAKAVFESFLQRAKQAREQEKVRASEVRILTRATPPSRAAVPPTLLILAASLGLGVIAGCATAWLRYMLNDGQDPRGPGKAQGAAIAAASPSPIPVNRSAINEAEVTTVAAAAVNRSARQKGVPSAGTVLGALPYLAPPAHKPVFGKQPHPTAPSLSFLDAMVALDRPWSPAAARFKSAVGELLDRLVGFASDRSPAVALIVSPAPAAGVSTVALSLAYFAARSGLKTLLVDGCTTDPALTRVFATPPDGADRPFELKQGLDKLIVTDEGTGLGLLPLGDLAIDELDDAGAKKLSAALVALAQEYDLVLIDAGSTDDDAPASALSEAATSLVAVVASATQAKDALRRMGRLTGLPIQNLVAVEVAAAPR